MASDIPIHRGRVHGSLNRIVQSFRRYILRVVDWFDSGISRIEKLSMTSKPSYNLSILSGKALMKFCEERGRPSGGLAECVQALETGDKARAIAAFKSIPLSGGMMSFSDWFPPVLYEGENPDYVQAVFDALTERFYRLAVNVLEIKGASPRVNR